MIWKLFRKKSPLYDLEHEELWNMRMQALEKLYGRPEEYVGHAPIPFFLGNSVGGATDIVYFDNHINGRLSVTADLIGRKDQRKSKLGHYELAIVHRDKEEQWGPNAISKLAYYTLEAILQPGETMDVGEVAPEQSSIDAFMFFDYGRFQILNQDCGVLLCMGITKEEKEACFEGREDAVIRALKEKNIFPYTDIQRESVI